MLDRVHTPFDPRLNDAVLRITDSLVGNYCVADDAPGTYAALKRHLDAGQLLIVAAAGSSATIFGDPTVNYAFRAWHDWCHWKGECDFSLNGEMATCCIQLSHVQRFYGLNDRTCYWRSLLIAEMIGQRRYYELHREYVEDQRAFTRAYIADPQAALAAKW